MGYRKKQQQQQQKSQRVGLAYYVAWSGVGVRIYPFWVRVRILSSKSGSVTGFYQKPRILDLTNYNHSPVSVEWLANRKTSAPYKFRNITRYFSNNFRRNSWRQVFSWHVIIVSESREGEQNCRTDKCYWGLVYTQHQGARRRWLPQNRSQASTGPRPVLQRYQTLKYRCFDRLIANFLNEYHVLSKQNYIPNSIIPREIAVLQSNTGIHTNKKCFKNRWHQTGRVS